jgi:hypothetical protein
LGTLRLAAGAWVALSRDVGRVVGDRNAGPGTIPGVPRGATLERAVGLGGTLERGRTSLGGNDRWFAIVRDPSGVSFGLWTPNPPSEP